MSDHLNIADFLLPVNLHEISHHEEYKDGQLGKLIDLYLDSPFRHENFLMEMLTGEPNYIRHYNHIGFQSYFVHPRMLETMDKLRFDCYRVGSVKENIDEMEPVIRNSNMLSFDITAMAHAYAPANTISPNG